MKKRLTAGFTLVELLVVTGIMVILMGLGMVSFSGAQKQTRDTQRRSDLGQYRNALENYAAANGGVYATASGAALLTSYCSTNLGVLMASCLADPLNSGSNIYRIRASPTAYVIYTLMESRSIYWVVCSNGESGNSASAPGSTACPI